MSEVVFEPRPRYVVEFGTVEMALFDGAAGPVMSWEFWRAYETRQLAVLAAERKSVEVEFVRVVDRGEA